jgi:nucleotide-binding universal stress UspA family protein
MERIVVGIDGSADARRALRWGLKEAAVHGAELQLVHAYPTPELVALPAVVTLPSDDELRKAAEDVIAEVLAGEGGPGEIPVTTTVMAGGAASVLCEVAKGALMMVVGARGLGGFRGLLLGSVTHQVVAHSPCPVVVAVPEPR